MLCVAQSHDLSQLYSLDPRFGACQRCLNDKNYFILLNVRRHYTNQTNQPRPWHTGISTVDLSTLVLHTCCTALPRQVRYPSARPVSIVLLLLVESGIPNSSPTRKTRTSDGEGKAPTYPASHRESSTRAPARLFFLLADSARYSGCASPTRGATAPASCICTSAGKATPSIGPSRPPTRSSCELASLALYLSPVALPVGRPRLGDFFPQSTLALPHPPYDDDDDTSLVKSRPTYCR